ncbi:MAG TPA: geranylgeranyl reductase family protein [Acidimicrobiales bacterium]|nr:geranylgeranyl reductase family protein [Acidimicrobiales bacterium]
MTPRAAPPSGEPPPAKKPSPTVGAKAAGRRGAQPSKKAAKAPAEKPAKAPAEKPAVKKVSTRAAGTAKTPTKKATAAQGSKAAASTAAPGPRPGAARHVHDVVVIGAGPAGSSCAYWLAQAGWDVAVVEKKQFPRVKTCGDGLTPRAVRQLADMGLEGALSRSHRFTGLRAYGFGQSVEMQWPTHPHFPSYGYTITRFDLDGLVADHAVRAGATLHPGTEVVEPVLAEGGVPGALPELSGVTVKPKDGTRTRQIHGRYVVVADGANSRVGRMLGTERQRELPLGMALRGYYSSDRHDDPYIESHLDIRDGEGNVVPGYGWIFPLGDGRVNVGVGLLSTERRWKGVNTSHLMEAFVQWAPKSWGIAPETSLGPPTGGKLPMGLSVGPRAGHNVVVVGDAAGAINPFNGEGIAYGYETGRLAAAALGHALTGGGPHALVHYDRQLRAAYGPYYKVARAFVHLISHPQAMKACVGIGMRSQVLMEQLLRIMANLMRPDAHGPAEVGYRGLEMLARFLPEDSPDRQFAPI